MSELWVTKMILQEDEQQRQVRERFFRSLRDHQPKVTVPKWHLVERDDCNTQGVRPVVVVCLQHLGRALGIARTSAGRPRIAAGRGGVALGSSVREW